MKRSKLLFVIVAAFLLMISTVSCTNESGTHVHKYGSWEITVEPTLTEKGEVVKVCECGRELKVAIAKLSDSSVWSENTELRVDPTCSTEGSATYTSIYGTVTINLEKVEHQYSEWEITVKPTLTTEGAAVRNCIYGESEGVVLPTLNDETVWSLTSSTAPTCLEAGYDTYTSVYGEVEVETLPATGHTFGDWTIVTEPNLTTEGEAVRKCHCGEEEKVTLPVLTDTTVWTVKSEVSATCTVAGEKVFTSVYGEVKLVLEATGHTFGSWVITEEPTESTTGMAVRKCHCGEEETAILEALTDAETWTLTKDEKPTYNAAGGKVYSSVYGEVKIVLEKLVAPYDGKTYSNLAFDADDDNEGFKNGVVYPIDSWNKATITLNKVGEGEAKAFPFRGLNMITMVNPETGLLEYAQVPYVSDEDGNLSLDYNDVTKLVAYVDFASGLIVRVYRNNFNNVLLLTPFETQASGDNAVASSWENAMAIEYTYGETVYRIFIYKGVVYFGVTFEDAAGQAVKADACYNAPYLYVKNSKGELIEGFAFNGEKEVVVDGFEGTYVSGSDTLVISGFGTATYNGVQGTYSLVEGETFTAHLYAGDVYYEVTLNKETKEAVVVKPMVEITLDGGNYGTVETVSVNKNIAYALPTLTNELQAFKGWFYDAEFTQAVEENFVPTKNVTLYAKWKAKVVVNLVGVVDGDPTVLYLGAGDVIGDALPKYTVVETTLMRFVGWYLDAEYNDALSESAKVSEEDSNLTIYAKWEKLPAYYGSYKGNEIWGTTSGNKNSNKADLNIDADGNITGKFTGKVVSYDSTTQKITWQKSGSTKTYGLWFDEEAGVIATHYSSQSEIGVDFYLFSKAQESNIFNAHYGLNCTKPGSTLTGYYARLVTLTTNKGVQDILVYGDRIYSNVTVSDTAGNALAVEKVQDSKTVVVRDATTNEIIIALASLGESFRKNTKTKALDKYFGTYTCGSETVVLDGTGVITYDGKTGTYTVAAEGASYGFDVYLNEKAEYYQLTLNGTECVMNKPTVEITFVVGEGHVNVPSINANINVAVSLPDATEENYVFNGWFFDQAFTKAVPSTFVPTEAVTLYAKHSNPADLTIVYNNGEENKVIRYSVGDVVRISMPTYAKHMFIGWYTSPEFEEGTVWTSGTVIENNLTIYAKWEVAPAYNNDYLPVELYGTNKNGSTSSVYTRTAAILKVDPYGKAPSTGYPFNDGDVSIEDYNPEQGTLTILSGKNAYKGYIDLTTGVIVMTYKSGDKATFGEVIFLNPFDTKATQNDFTASYWNAGMTRAIQYTYNGTTYSYFVFKNQVFMNVSFKDGNNNDVAADDCYTTSTLYVYANDGTQIAKFGYDGTTMQELDGYEGTYTNGENTVILNGVDAITLNGVKGVYNVAEGSTYTIDAYVENTYYEVTLSVTDYTYTINKPMVEITFDTAGKTEVPAQTLNKNIQVTLPLTDIDGFIFRGWYLDAEFTQAVGATYTPTETLTLYAKWDEAAILTVVYGNGLETVDVKYGVGDTVNPVKPVFTNGLVFDGWYLDSEFATPYTATTIEQNTTIYCKWKAAVAMYGKYTGFEVYGSSDSYINITNNKTFEVDENGKTKSNESNVVGTIYDYNEETGNFKIKLSNGNYRFGHFDQLSGIIAVNYSTNKEELGNDQYIFFSGVTKAMGEKSKSHNLGKGYARFVTVSDNSVASTEFVIFVYGTKVYTNVTFTGAESLSKAATSPEFSVFDSKGNLIVKFNKSTIVTE